MTVAAAAMISGATWAGRGSCVAERGGWPRPAPPSWPQAAGLLRPLGGHCEQGRRPGQVGSSGPVQPRGSLCLGRPTGTPRLGLRPGALQPSSCPQASAAPQLKARDRLEERWTRAGSGSSASPVPAQPLGNRGGARPPPSLGVVAPCCTFEPLPQSQRGSCLWLLRLPADLHKP